MPVISQQTTMFHAFCKSILSRCLVISVKQSTHTKIINNTRNLFNFSRSVILRNQGSTITKRCLGCCSTDRNMSSLDKKTFTVCVEGNIGSGKTTLLNHFAQDPLVEVYPEPVNKWRDVSGHNALAKMYEDPQRWCFAFQKYVQLTMLLSHTQAHTCPVKMMERSIHSSRFCFVENLYQSGTMCEFDYIVFSKWYDWILKTQDVSVDLIVYLQTSPETVYHRIMERSREEESEIPMDYLRALHNQHEDWLINQKNLNMSCPVLVLDADSDLDAMQLLYEEKRHQILQKI